MGVCSGMQCINEVFKGRTVRAPLPVHGKTDMINHNSCGIFQNILSPFPAARYHSLIIEPKNSDLIITAWTNNIFIMGIEHNKYPVFGVQFHPESFLTLYGDF